MKSSIGIFDSGLGGLTVLKLLSQKYPQESFCYLGDIARLPYGNKSPETIRRYGLQVLEFLKEQNVKAIIIACNSASTVFLGEHEFKGIPLLNVIEPGAAAALKVSNGLGIGVIGTSATINSHAYQALLHASRPGERVMEKSCPLFVPLVEEGILGDTITKLVIQKYLGEMIEQKIKTLILGCTHYPVLKNDLKVVLGNDVTLVESGEVLGEVLEELFVQGKIQKSTEPSRDIRVCTTDITDHFERLSLELMAPIKIGPLERVVL